MENWHFLNLIYTNKSIFGKLCHMYWCAVYNLRRNCSVQFPGYALPTRQAPLNFFSIEIVELAHTAGGQEFVIWARSVKRPSCDSSWTCLSPHQTGALYCSRALHVAAAQEMRVESLTTKSNRSYLTLKLPLRHASPKKATSEAGPALPSGGQWCHQGPAYTIDWVKSSSPGRVWSNCPTSSMNKPSLHS